MQPTSPPPGPSPETPDRRQFLVKACTVALGGAAVVPPLAGGVAVALDPLRRGGDGTAAPFVRITNLEALPADGIPRKFTVMADRVDAWNRYPRSAVGAIYLRRTSDKEIVALHTSCPHAGCFVDYVSAKNNFYCPCHNSAFGLDGSIESKMSPSARPLDTLDVEIRNEREVWVRFQNFRMGTAEKIPV